MDLSVHHQQLSANCSTQNIEAKIKQISEKQEGNTKPQTLRATQETIAKLDLSYLSTVQSRLGIIRFSLFSKIEGIASWVYV